MDIHSERKPTVNFYSFSVCFSPPTVYTVAVMIANRNFLHCTGIHTPVYTVECMTVDSKRFGHLYTNT